MLSKQRRRRSQGQLDQQLREKTHDQLLRVDHVANLEAQSEATPERLRLLTIFRFFFCRD